jgi:CRP-like cAMP-binding protein
VAPSPPAPADPSPWRQVLGEPALDDTQVRQLLQLSRRRRVASGDVIFGGPQAAGHLVLLLSGDVALGTPDGEGGLRSERCMAAPAWLDASSAWLATPFPLTALALNDVVIAELPVDDLRALLPQAPALADRLLVVLAQRIHELTDAARDLRTKDAPSRLAHWLLLRCEAAGVTGDGPRVLMLQQRKRDIASELGITPETLSRLIRSFTRQGVLEVTGYRVTLHDLAGLRALAGEG